MGKTVRTHEKNGSFDDDYEDYLDHSESKHKRQRLAEKINKNRKHDKWKDFDSEPEK